MLGFYNYTVWLTYGSFLSSVVGIFLGFRGYPVPATFCLLLCAILDTFDGAVARTKKDRTPKEKRFGIQIDSLSDCTAFGLLPCAVGYGLLFDGNEAPWMLILYMVASCLISLAALIRLANFNVEEEMRQDETDEKRAFFTGVPVPFSAIVVPLLVVLVEMLKSDLAGYIVFVAALPIIGLLFLMKKIHLPKPNAKGLVVLFLLGTAELILLLRCL